MSDTGEPFMPRRVFPFLLCAAISAFAAALNTNLTAQATLPATAQLTARPPKIATPEPAANTTQVSAQYVGSLACQRCHAATFERWSHTRMANVITDPKVNPNVVLGDFSKPNPLVNFRLEDVAFVYGTKWKQRYFLRKGNDYYPANAQWDVTNKVWRPYFLQPNTEWWVAHYPAAAGDNTGRPTGPLCDGCHSTNYDVEAKRTTEWNVGCERCHGPGSAHVARPTRANIIDPSRLDYVSANDTCIQCHSQGQPLQNPIAGQIHDWPVGFHMGLKLKDFWKLEEHHLGEQSYTHYAEGPRARTGCREMISCRVRCTRRA